MKNRKNNQSFLLILGIIFVAFNLRPAITSVGPVIGLIRTDIGFAHWNIALLMSLPLIAFAILSPITPIVANRLSNELTLIIGLIFLMIGISLRSISIIWLLFLGTLLVGLGVAVCNVLLPSIIKEKFPLKVGLMTGIYTTCMGILATAASGLSLPLAEGLNLGWQLSLFIWGIPALFALVIWIAIYRRTNVQDNNVKFIEPRSSSIWSSRLAWMVACFMGLQSLIFYVTISWLPEILVSFGMEQFTAGYMLSYFQLVGIPTSFVVPIIAGRLENQTVLVVSNNIGYIIGIILLLTSPSFWVIGLAVTLIGISSSSNFALALFFLSVRAKTKIHSAQLSGMAQSIGYALAAVGPMFIGFIFDLTYSWTLPLIILIVVTLFIIYFGSQAGQNKYVLD